ncbi:hypothetical protein G9A89_019028 [Geosiphon pyriformis]|nr:hypothetical protein G9A89_019028 [Geosiphon pyriformis]
MRWVKVKGYFAHAASHSSLFLLVGIHDRFFVADSLVVFGNAWHFIYDVCRTVCHVLWEAGLGVSVLASSFLHSINWECTVSVWHPNFYMLAGFTSKRLTALCIYLMKAVHGKLPVAVHKRLYNTGYLSVLCLMCGDVKFFDHAFTLLNTLANALDVSIYAVLCKSFKESPVNCCRVCSPSCRSKFRVDMKKVGLVCNDDGIFALPQGLLRLLSNGVVCMLDVVESFAVSFGLHRHCLFFSGLNDDSGVLVSM